MPILGYFDTPFASSGPTATVPDAIQTDGSVSYEGGYGVNYTLNPATDPSALNVENTKMNQIFNDVTKALQYIQQNGAAPFITTTMNGGTPFSYAKGAIVSFDPGSGIENYISLDAANVTDPTDPSWQVLGTAASASVIFPGGNAGGTANALTLTAVGFTQVTGNGVVFQATATNTAAATININGDGVENLVKLNNFGSTAFSGGELITGGMYIAVFNGSAYELLNPSTDDAPQPIQGDYKALQVSRASNTTISISADEIVLQKAGTKNTYTTPAVTLTNTITGSGANGLDTGSLSANGWFYVYVIYNGTTIASLLSASPTSPTLPSGYTYYARVSSVRLDGSTHVVGFTKLNRQWQYRVGDNLSGSPLICSGVIGSTSVPTYVSQSLNDMAPPDAIELWFEGQSAGGGDTILAPNGAYGAWQSASNPPMFSWGQGGIFAWAFGRMLLESAFVYFASSDSSSKLFATGFTEKF